MINRFKLSALLICCAVRIYAGASGGGGTIFVGTVTPGIGASFQQFDYVEIGSDPLYLVQAYPAALPQYATEVNAILSAPNDGTNVVNEIGFSNGTSQPLGTFTSSILVAAAASGLLGGLDPNTATITNSSTTVYFVQIGTFRFLEVVATNFTVGAPITPVAIMIKPAAAPPVPINAGAMGTIPVAILSSPAFDATANVNRSSLTFGHSGAEASLWGCDPGGVDVNGDGLADLVCHFYSQQTKFAAGDTMGILQGTTASGASAIQGAEAITIVP